MYLGRDDANVRLVEQGGEHTDDLRGDIRKYPGVDWAIEPPDGAPIERKGSHGHNPTRNGHATAASWFVHLQDQYRWTYPGGTGHHEKSDCV